MENFGISRYLQIWLMMFVICTITLPDKINKCIKLIILQYYQILLNSNSHQYMQLLIIFSTLFVFSHTRCSFQVTMENKPVKVDREPFLIQGMTQCVEYNGLMGCCDAGNDQQQSKSFVELDGIFSSLGGGCDICAINLKRFWCEYACSPNQSEFTTVQQGYKPVPNPQKPDQTLMVQIIQIRVHADTGCQLFNACSRNQFVSSVSAMTTPAGFLTFQGHNAVNDALQYMQMKFSYNESSSIHFSDSYPQKARKSLSSCNTTTKQTQIHGFPFLQNCTCNNCGTMCKDGEGFIYTQSPLMEGFNYVLVFSVWGFAVLVSTIITLGRRRQKKIGEQGQKLIGGLF